MRLPAPSLPHPEELNVNAPLGRWNLYIGGAGRSVPGYVNLDLVALPGVDVQADAHELPFDDGIFQRVECEDVLDRVEHPERVMGEIERVLAPGGFVHIVAPFCHPSHGGPKDFRRYTPDGLRMMAGKLTVVKTGWRTGPAATWIAFTLEFAQMLLPWRWWRVVARGTLSLALWPLRFLDLWLTDSARGARLGNRCYAWLRKPGPHSHSEST